LFVSIIALVYSRFWGQTVTEFLPYVAAGYFVWIFIATSLTESCSVYHTSGAFFQTAPISPITFNMRLVVRNLIVFMHSFVVFIAIAIYAKINLLYILWVIPGALVLSVFCFGASVILAILCSRYRDFEQIIGSIILLGFFVTPILYQVSMLGDDAPAILKLNIFTYMVEIIREPMLGRPPSLHNYIVAGSISVFTLIMSVIVYSSTRKRLYLWT